MTTCLCCGGESKYFAKFQNRNRIVRRFRCQQCRKTFSEPQPLDDLRIDHDKVVQIVKLLTYTFLAVTAREKFIVSFQTGKRDLENTDIVVGIISSFQPRAFRPAYCRGPAQGPVGRARPALRRFCHLSISDQC